MIILYTYMFEVVNTFHL